MTVDEAVVAIGAFLQPFMPSDTQIIRGMDNNVPTPWAKPFIVITEVGQPQYTTTRTTVSQTAQSMTFDMPTYLNFQLDFYGDEAGYMVKTAVTMLRSVYAPDKFPEGVKPLYCSDATQAPMITGEKQFQTRWLCTLSLQYNSSVVVSQQTFVNVGDIAIDPVDITIPAE